MKTDLETAEEIGCGGIAFSCTFGPHSWWRRLRSSAADARTFPFHTAGRRNKGITHPRSPRPLLRDGWILSSGWLLGSPTVQSLPLQRRHLPLQPRRLISVERAESRHGTGRLYGSDRRGMIQEPALRWYRIVASLSLVATRNASGRPCCDNGTTLASTSVLGVELFLKHFLL